MVGIKMKNLFQAGMALLGLAAVLCIAGGREAGKGCAGEQEALTVHGLEVCHLQNPLGIDEELAGRWKVPEGGRPKALTGSMWRTAGSIWQRGSTFGTVGK